MTRNWKKILKNIWYFIWEDDSLLSWVVNIVLAFILIKFIVYPLLGLMLATSHPIVAVVSGSMEHKTVHPCIERDALGLCKSTDKDVYAICGNKFSSKQKVNNDFFWLTCSGFYEEFGITKEDFSTYPLKKGFNTGDIMVLRGKKPKDIEIGDVIVFWGSKEEPIIHRVVKKTLINERYIFQTKGDHNSKSNSDELAISKDMLIGKAVLRVPFFGWIKILFLKAVSLFKVV